MFLAEYRDRSQPEDIAAEFNVPLREVQRTTTRVHAEITRQMASDLEPTSSPASAPSQAG
jgi:hypothetical protein